jgi:hypothetical protein
MNNFKLKPGVNICSNEEYHSDLAWLSSSKLKMLATDPAKFYKEVVLKQAGDAVSTSTQAAYDLGSYVHTLCLEPHMEHEEYATFSGWRKQGAAWEAFKLQHANSGKKLLSMPQVELGRALAKSLQARPEALELLKNGEPELSICTHLSDVPVKKRSDYINVEAGYIADVKTTGYPAGKEQFKQTVKDFSYDLSAALYTAIAEKYYGKPFKFYFIVISKVDKQCDVYEASTETLLRGTKAVNAALNNYKQCLKSGIWTLPESQQSASIKEVEKDYIIEAV